MYFYKRATIRPKRHQGIMHMHKFQHIIDVHAQYIIFIQTFMLICVNADYSNTIPGLVGFSQRGSILLLRNVMGC